MMRLMSLRESALPAANCNAIALAAATTSGGDGGSNAKAKEELDMGNLLTRSCVSQASINRRPPPLWHADQVSQASLALSSSFQSKPADAGARDWITRHDAEYAFRAR